jgi:hypothetical protein
MSRSRETTLPCILCDTDSYFGWWHHRSNCTMVQHREAMALAHGLVLA